MRKKSSWGAGWLQAGPRADLGQKCSAHKLISCLLRFGVCKSTRFDSKHLMNNVMPRVERDSLGGTLAQRAVSLPQQKMRGELMWIRWFSGSALLQGTSVVMCLFSMARLVESQAGSASSQTVPYLSPTHHAQFFDMFDATSHNYNKLHQAQPPSCYGALVKREEDNSKEEVPGSNPCGGDKDALHQWESMGGSFLNARDRTASALINGGLGRGTGWAAYRRAMLTPGRITYNPPDPRLVCSLLASRPLMGLTVSLSADCWVFA
eukprot:1143307-Pelagomonas_calceolata.AAC.1